MILLLLTKIGICENGICMCFPRGHGDIDCHGIINITIITNSDLELAVALAISFWVLKIAIAFLIMLYLYLTLGPGLFLLARRI